MNAKKIENPADLIEDVTQVIMFKHEGVEYETYTYLTSYKVKNNRIYLFAMNMNGKIVDLKKKDLFNNDNIYLDDEFDIKWVKEMQVSKLEDYINEIK